jgi:hypothetical protein
VRGDEPHERARHARQPCRVIRLTIRRTTAHFRSYATKPIGTAHVRTGHPSRTEAVSPHSLFVPQRLDEGIRCMRTTGAPSLPQALESYVAYEPRAVSKLRQPPNARFNGRALPPLMKRTTSVARAPLQSLVRQPARGQREHLTRLACNDSLPLAIETPTARINRIRAAAYVDDAAPPPARVIPYD